MGHGFLQCLLLWQRLVRLPPGNEGLAMRLGVWVGLRPLILLLLPLPLLPFCGRPAAEQTLHCMTPVQRSKTLKHGVKWLDLPQSP